MQEPRGEEWEDAAALDALSSLVAARRSIEQAERELRVTLRRHGVSWARLGRVYGVSRQAARARFGNEAQGSDTRRSRS